MSSMRKTMEDISDLETITYKWSRQISEFNYDTNLHIFKQICNFDMYEKYVGKILYVVSVIELLGVKYIRVAIALHEHNFMIHEDEFSETISKYIDWKNQSASYYTIIMRNAAKIIEHKYKL